MKWTRIARLIGAAALLSLLGIQATFARQSGQAAQGTQTFTLPAGGSATLTFEAFCAQFGEDFPEGVGAPSSVASERVQAALAYAQQQGLTGSGEQALQVQYAIWELLGATDSPRGEQAARDVVAQASAAPAPPQGATSLLAAAQAGDVQLTVDSWQPVGQPVQITPDATDNFYGRGQFTVRNTSQQELTLYLPYGAIFPATDPADQDMVGYATDVQTSGTEAAQAATATVAATATTATTATVAATATTAATATVAATATTAATATVAATGTTVATATTGPATLPQTSGGGGSAMLLLVAAGLALLAAGGHLVRGLVRR
jgi:hypothetical protein